MTSFAAVASLPPSSAFSSASTSASPSSVVSREANHEIPSGPWTLYVHSTEEKKWKADTFKRIHMTGSWEELGAVLREMGPARVLNTMMFAMRGTRSPLWENKDNIGGGTYSFVISRRKAVEVYMLYLAAAATDTATVNPANKIVGVTMSPKKGHCVIKLLNTSYMEFNKSSDIAILHEDVADIRIVRNTDQKM